MRPQPDSSRAFKRRIIFTILSVALALLVTVGVVVVNRSATGKQAKVSPQPTSASPQQGAGSSTPTVSASPLLFGTNLGLFTADDQVVTSATTRALMQHIPIRIVRIPMRVN